MNERSLARFNLRPHVSIGIVKQSNANAVAVARAVRAEVDAMQASLPPGYHLTVSYDGARFIEESVAEVQEELDRAKVGLRASLIMQGESSNARAGSSAGDFYHLGRVRGLEEIEQAILSLTVDDVIDYVKRNRPGNFTVVTLGPKQLTVNS